MVTRYDRLVIPVPPEGAMHEPFWTSFDAERQSRCLEILGVRTDKKDGLALTVPWDNSKRTRFSNRMSLAAALATQHRNPEQTCYVDPFKMTRELIKNEFRPALPPGVSHAWVVAAFRSVKAYRETLEAATRQARQRQLAAQITPVPYPARERFEARTSEASRRTEQHRPVSLTPFEVLRVAGNSN